MYPIVIDGEAKPVKTEVAIPGPTPIPDPTKTLVLARLPGLFFQYVPNWPQFYHGKHRSTLRLCKAVGMTARKIVLSSVLTDVQSLRKGYAADGTAITFLVDWASTYSLGPTANDAR